MKPVTIIIETSDNNRCDMRVYDGKILNKIEQSIDLDDDLLLKRTDISMEKAVAIVRII